ncbi:MAG: MarR family transcriptional regulator [bacterium]
MVTKKQKIEEMLESFSSLRHSMAFYALGTEKMPRITSSQWGALMLIEKHEEIAVKDIANILGITSSATTQLIDGLFSSGYVNRKTSVLDRRTVILTLSKDTKIHIKQKKKQVLEKFIKIFEVFSEKEFDQYLLLNKKIVDKLLTNKIKN